MTLGLRQVFFRIRTSQHRAGHPNLGRNVGERQTMETNTINIEGTLQLKNEIKKKKEERRKGKIQVMEKKKQSSC